MDIKNYIDNLLLQQGETDAVVVEIYKTGSQLFKEGGKDLDYCVICTGLKQRYVMNIAREEGVIYDFFILDVTAVEAQQDFNDMYYITPKIKIYAYTTQVKEVIYGGYNNGWDMMEHEEDYKKYLKDRYDNTLVTIIRGTNYRHGKFYAHYYLILKMYENQKAELTESMISDVNILYTQRDQSRNDIIDWVIAELDKIN